MTVTIEGKNEEHTQHIHCVCGRPGTVKFSVDGVCPPDGWYVASFESTAKRTFELVPACSRVCIHVMMAARTAQENADLNAKAQKMTIVGAHGSVPAPRPHPRRLPPRSRPTPHLHHLGIAAVVRLPARRRDAGARPPPATGAPTKRSMLPGTCSPSRTSSSSPPRCSTRAPRHTPPCNASRSCAACFGRPFRTASG